MASSGKKDKASSSASSFQGSTVSVPDSAVGAIDDLGKAFSPHFLFFILDFFSSFSPPGYHMLDFPALFE